MSPVVAGFLSGLTTMCFMAIGLCFMRFWQLNRDALFVAFALAFWLLAAQQALLGLSVVPREERSWVYLLRVAAFLVIAVAIVWKNVRQHTSGVPRVREDASRRR